METDPRETEDLIRLACGGDEGALAELFRRYRQRLRRMVELRLDRRLQGRIDPSDVLQEAFIDLTNRMPRYAADPAIPFFLWLRMVTGERLLAFHRRHLKAAMRDIGRALREKDEYHVVVVTSTVLPGSTRHGSAVLVRSPG